MSAAASVSTSEEAPLLVLELLLGQDALAPQLAELPELVEDVVPALPVPVARRGRGVLRRRGVLRGRRVLGRGVLRGPPSRLAAGDAIARASAALIGCGVARMSTTTISLPMPFILTKLWLASALMLPSI